MSIRKMMMILPVFLAVTVAVTTTNAAPGDLIQTFANPSRGQKDFFGQSITTVGNNVLIGASRAAGAGLEESWAAYLFDPNGTLLHMFKNPQPLYNHGCTVAAFGKNVLIGAFNDSQSNKHGLVYLFDGMTYELLHTFVNPSDGYTGFGLALTANENFVIISDPAYRNNTGIVYLYDASNFELLRMIHNPDPDPDGDMDQFGFSVTAKGDKVIIGSKYHNTEVIKYFGAGAAYLFDVNGTLLTTFVNPDPNEHDSFGHATAFVGNNIAIVGDMDNDAYLFDPNGVLLKTFHNPNEGNPDYEGCWFGESVVAIGNTVLIGDRAYDSYKGIMYLFDSSSGNLLFSFTNPTPEDSDGFGSAVATLGNNVLITANRDHSNDNVGGAVYLFEGFPFGDLDQDKVIYVDADAVGANNGTSWNDAYTFLQDALANANDSEKPVEIHVAQGIYKPNEGGQIQPNNPREATFCLDGDVTLKGGYAGISEPDPDARDVELYPAILSGDLNGDDLPTEKPPLMLAGPTRIDNSYHVIDVRSISGTVVLDGFTITGGNAADNEIYPCWSPDLFGGGLRSHTNGEGGHPEVTICNCTFKSNSANNSGGAIDYYSDRPLTVVNCEFTGNFAINGGAIEADGEESSTLYLIGCNFVGNSAVCGGAVSNDTRRSSTKTTCIRKVTMTGCAFIRNRAQYGGAAYVMADELELSESLFAGNCAGQYFWTLNGLVLPVVTNEGSSDAFCGSFYIAGYIGAVVTNCTFASNSAPSGNTTPYDSGLETSLGTLQLHNCILWDEKTPICNANGLAIEVEYSDIRGGWDGEGNIDADPLFAAPGCWDPNGTLYDTNDDFWVNGDYHLKSQGGRWDPNRGSWIQDDVTSPSIDAGDPNSSIGDEPFPNGGIINMGAYGGTADASKSYFGELVYKRLLQEK
jgi:hypothetical protein